MKSYINDAHGDPEELDSSILYFEGLRPPIDYSKKEIFLLNKANQLKNSHKYESGILNVFLSLLRLNPLPLKINSSRRWLRLMDMRETLNQNTDI